MQSSGESAERSHSRSHLVQNIQPSEYHKKKIIFDCVVPAVEEEIIIAATAFAIPEAYAAVATNQARDHLISAVYSGLRSRRSAVPRRIMIQSRGRGLFRSKLDLSQVSSDEPL